MVQRRPLRSNARRAAIAVLVLALAWTLAPGAQADTQEDLDAARAKLASLEARIQTNRDRLKDIDGQVRRLGARMDRLALRLLGAQDRFDRVQTQAMTTRAELDAAQEDFRTVRGELDDRAREAYQQGPAGSLAWLLGSANINDLNDRLEFITELSNDDRALAEDVQSRALQLDGKRRQLEAVMAQQIHAVNLLERDQASLDDAFATQSALLDEQTAVVQALEADRETVLALVEGLEDALRQEELAAAREAARLAAIAAARQAAEREGRPVPNIPPGEGPFLVCPVDEPKTYGDGFGAPRYGGGYHPHAGNDILAPTGTPVRATFDGVAEAHPNSLGGLAVIVTGEDGYTYNAHFSRYGTLGRVTAGTIIGYVGDSGNAQGGPPHDHFEWHPNVMPADPWVSPYGYSVIEDAVDPYPYLNLVC